MSSRSAAISAALHLGAAALLAAFGPSPPAPPPDDPAVAVVLVEAPVPVPVLAAPPEPAAPRAVATPPRSRAARAVAAPPAVPDAAVEAGAEAIDTAAAPAAPAADTADTADTVAIAAEPLRPLAGNPRPLYPLAARRRGEEGTCLVRAHVTEDGAVHAAEVVGPSGSAHLDEAARDAVRRWRFAPARRVGRAVADTVDVPVTFRLRDTREVGDG